MRKIFIVLLVVLCARSAFAQSTSGTQAVDPAKTPVQASGSLAAGIFGFDSSTESAKLTEYRDLRRTFYLPKLTFSMVNPPSGWMLDIAAANVGRNDQTILAKTGQPGVWAIQAEWRGTPHNYSNKAVTPYIDRGGGLLTVPATVPITFKRLATSAADIPSVLASDDLIAAYQASFLGPTALATQTNTGHFAATWSGSGAFSLGVAYDLRDKKGSKPGFGPIGDRPPRTLNIQLAEPVDYRTNDLTFSAEHRGRGYQVRAEYLYSDFANGVDTLTWQNVYATAAPGADYDVWDRLVSTYGRRPLPPDNRYHNVTVSAGAEMPLDSRLLLTMSLGRLEQNEVLLPYAYGDSALLNRALPRSRAKAMMKTVHAAADYVITPARGVVLRGFYRQYTLNNDTPSDQWQYVTQDTYNTAGTVSYLNKRVNLPVAWARRTYGAQAILRPARRNTLTLSFEHEDRDFDHREADTAENIFRAAWRVKPTAWISMEARYLYGDRTGTTYNNIVTHEGYWYTTADSPDNNNPAVTFDNHPDMRRFDVIDRKRQQVDVRISLVPRDLFSVSAYVRYRSDDYDAGVVPSTPLAGTGLPEQDAVSPGDQLGSLDGARIRYGADAFFLPTDSITLSAFLSYDEGSSFQRSLEYNENNKQNPSAIATAELGPWTRASSQWNADTTDRTWSGGFGASFRLTPNGLTLSADGMMSLAGVDIAYDGFGVQNWDGSPFPPNHQFSFSTPPRVREDLKALSIRFEIPVKTAAIVVGYSFETYKLEDWQQDSSAPWVEAVGSETLLRDTSRSYQWGNRLFNLGTYLAPGYEAHIVFLGLRYKF